MEAVSKRKYGHYNFAPTTGVRADFKKLMNNFLSHNTVRYEKFSEIWRQMNMSYFWACRSTDREAREYQERSFMIALEYFLSPYQFHVRVGGLYLLYGLYLMQPLVPKVKIRLTQPQWIDTMALQKSAAQQSHLDVVYIFKRLLVEHAFHFCFSSEDMSMKRGVIDVADNVASLADDLREERTRINQLFRYESVEQLTYLQDQYKQMKVSLAGPDATRPNKSLNVVQDTLVDSLMKNLQSFREKVSKINKFYCAGRRLNQCRVEAYFKSKEKLTKAQQKAQAKIMKKASMTEIITGRRVDFTEEEDTEVEAPTTSAAADSVGSRRLALKERAMSSIKGDKDKNSTYKLVVEDGSGPSAEERTDAESIDYRAGESNSESANESLQRGKRSLPSSSMPIIDEGREDLEDNYSAPKRQVKKKSRKRRKSVSNHEDEELPSLDRTPRKNMPIINEDPSTDDNPDDEDYSPPVKKSKAATRRKTNREDLIKSSSKSKLKNKTATRMPIADRRKSPPRILTESPKKRGRPKKEQEPEPDFDPEKFAEFQRLLRNGKFDDAAALSSSDSSDDEPMVKVCLPGFSGKDKSKNIDSVKDKCDNNIGNKSRSYESDLPKKVRCKKSTNFSNAIGDVTSELIKNKQSGKDTFFAPAPPTQSQRGRNRGNRDLYDVPLPEITKIVLKGNIGKKSMDETIKEMMQASKAKDLTSSSRSIGLPPTTQKIKVMTMSKKGPDWELDNLEERDYTNQQEYQNHQKMEAAIEAAKSRKRFVPKPEPKKPEAPVLGGFDMLFEEDADIPVSLPKVENTYARKQKRQEEETELSTPPVANVSKPLVPMRVKSKNLKNGTKYSNHVKLVKQDPYDLFLAKYLQKLKKEKLKELKRLKERGGKKDDGPEILSQHMLLAKKLAAAGNIDCITMAETIKKKVQNVDYTVDQSPKVLRNRNNDTAVVEKEEDDSTSATTIKKLPKGFKTMYL